MNSQLKGSFVSNKWEKHLSSLVLVSIFAFQIQSTYADINGEKVFMNNCMVCHADDGSGAMPGVADLTENREWLTLPESQLLSRLKKGIQKPGATVAMPPKGGNTDLTDDDIKAAIAYMRNTFFK